MKISCPECKEEIPVSDINISEAVFMCRRCNEVFPISGEKIEQEYIDADFDLKDVPSGVWVEDGFEGKVIGASCRSVGGALFTLVFGGMFTGIPSTIFLSGELEKEGWFGVLFIIPFLLVGLSALSICAVFIMGKTEVVLSDGICKAFTGVGSIGWKKEFIASDVSGVYMRQCGTKGGNNGRGGKPMYHIVLERESAGDVKFGMLIPDDKLEFVFAAVKTVLAELND